jgi:hypothetical protein
MPSGWSHANLEQFTDWSIQNTKDANPILADTTPLVYADAHITMSITGPQYAGWMLKHGFPILTLESGLITSSTDFWPSLDAVTAQVWEDDTRFTDGNGNIYVCDSQLNLQQGGVLMVANATGTGWIPTTFKPGIPPAGQWATLARVFSFGPNGCAIVSASAWGNNWTAPANQPGVPILPLGWTGPAQVVKQLQIGENALGNPFSLSYRNVNVSATGVIAA